VRAPDGTITGFDPKDATDTTPWDIDRAGATTGMFLTSDGVNHGFLRKPGGAIVRFDVDNADTDPRAINKHGVITGGFTYSGHTALHGFVRIP
jgi:hypothetical protein